MSGETAALGLRVRTGRAIAVVLRGTRRAPEIVVRSEIRLWNPAIPESGQPYHYEMEEPGSAGVAARRRGCAAARKSTLRAVRDTVNDMKKRDLALGAAGLVVASLTDPGRIAGTHPRAHAEEAKLYRDAVQASLAACKVSSTILLEKDIRAAAAGDLGITEGQLDATLKAFASAVGAPWRAYEKQAALAAWLALPKKAKG